MHLMNLLNKYRESINPPYSSRDYPVIGLTILILFIATVFVGNLPNTYKTEEDEQIIAEQTEGPTLRSIDTSRTVPDEILLKFKSGTSTTLQNKILSENNLVIKSEIPKIAVKVIKVAPQARDAVIEALSHNQAIEFAEVNGIAQATFIPDDSYFGQQWGPQKIQSSGAWDISTGSANVKIAILDTGIDTTHPEVEHKMTASVNFSSSTTDQGVHSHGTHVSGISAATTNNARGIAGIGFNSSLMNVKVLDDLGSGSYDWIANGIIWASDNGANVINMSFGGSSPSTTLENAINYAWNHGIVVVAAAGNNGSTVPMYPAYYSNVIAVGATDPNDRITSWSNRGDWVDIAAPGLNIYSIVPFNSYQTMSGTSMASPHVAGVAGLVAAQVADSNADGSVNDETRNCIQNNADNINVSGIGSGRVNAYRAVLCQNTSSLPTSTTTPFATNTPIPATPTPTPLPDPISPSVSITSPANGSTIAARSTVAIQTTASDNIGVTRVEFYVNNSLNCSDIASPYTCFWKVPGAKKKTYTITVRAYDAAGNSSTNSITVTAK